MRVLFADNPEPTTFLTMVPLAWALRTAGHEVRFASQPSFADTITQAGLTAVPVGRDTDMYRLMEVAFEELEISPGLHCPFDVVDNPENATWERMLPGYAESAEGEHRSENFPIISGLVDFARSWKPDLIIWEPSTYAGAIAAKACGAAHARLLATIDVLAVTREHFLRLKAEQPEDKRADPLADWLGSYGRKYDFEFSEDLVTGQFTINQLAPSLSIRADLDYLPLQFIPHGGRASVPKWLWTAPERPRVALTLGTTAAERFDDYTLNVQDTLDALGELDIEVVATLSESFQETLTRVPDNARIVPYVPLHALAPTCSAVINHAGAGTLLTVARYGVPQLSVPWDLDEPELARRLSAQGSGLMIRGDLATGKDVRDGVVRLLEEPAFAEQAAALRDEILGLPSPNEIVGQLEELTTKHRAAG